MLHIELFGSDQVIRDKRYRFVVIEISTTGRILILSPAHGGVSHWQMVPRDATHVNAGGFITAGIPGEAKYDSVSLLMEYGHDRPIDPEEATRLLKEVESTVESQLTPIEAA